MAAQYFIGFDVGSEFVHSVTLDDRKQIVYAPKSVMHAGDITSPVKLIYEQVEKEFGAPEVYIAFTGSGGKVIAKTIDAPFYQDTLTIPRGADFISPDSRYVFHIGSRDSYFFEKNKIGSTKIFRVSVPDYSTCTKCGGGSGLLLTKQCRRFFENITPENNSLQEIVEQMYAQSQLLAENSDKSINIGGRCGVIIQSDMIHAQNDGEKPENIFRGLFERIAENYRNGVVSIRRFDSDSMGIATGRVAKNQYVIDMLRKHLGLNLNVPDNHEKVGAIGAALFASEKRTNGFCFHRLEEVAEAERKQLMYAPALKDSLDKVVIYPEPASRKIEDLNVFLELDARIPVVMGIDGGSTTTKVVLLTMDLNPIAESCIETHGRPLESVQKIFGQIKKYLGNYLDVRAVAYTGSAGALYYKLFTDFKNRKTEDLADIVKDEITCHKLGVRHFNKNVDTIFELGGQDAKFTFLDGDSVKKSKMNLSCMAGTGQTMQNMIKTVGLNFDEFEELALRAEKTPIVDESCGVFTEAGIAQLVSLGLPKTEIAAAIAYGFLGGYINKFVGNKPVGNCISAQGGPFKNKACLAALAAHTGKQINAFPHRQILGAYGAALVAHENLD